jgi:adenylate cyclase
MPPPMTRRSVRTTFRQLWWAPLLCCALAWLLARTDTGREFEWRTLDWRTQARVPWQPPPDSRVVLVLFDDDTEMNLVSWPPPRNYHGTLIELMSVAGLRVACMDVFLTAPRDAETDALMAAGAQAARERGTEVVTGAVSSEFEVAGEDPAAAGPTRPLRRIEGDASRLVGDEYAAAPFAALRAVTHYGFVDVEKEARDGIVRRLPLVVRIGRDIYPGLALQTLMRHFGVEPEQVHGRLGDALHLPVRGREVRIPMDARGRVLVNYRHEALNAPSIFPTYSYRGLLLGLHARHVEPNPNALPPPLLRGKIAIIGLFATGNADAGPTPLSPFSPLPLVHANLVDNVLGEDFAREADPRWVWALALVVGWLAVGLTAGRSVNLLVTGTVLVAGAYVAAAFGAWIAASLWLPLVGPLTGFGLLQFLLIARRIVEEQRAKQAIQGMFGAYVSPQVVERLVSAGTPPRLGGHEETVTAYFSDIQGFSGFSERLPAPRLVELMNEYLTACTDIVQEEGGTLDKYIGDAVVAMFGAPVPQPDHAYRACVSALRVQRRLGELREKWRAEGDRWPPVVAEMRSRIGLNSGRVVVGNMGSRTRFNYTMMGDDVNLAARMESGAKSWGSFLLCTESTRSACVAHGGDRILFRPLGRIVVKGRTQAVPIFDVVGFREDLAPSVLECLGRFAEGLGRFHAQDWDAAERAFRLSLALEPLQPGRDPGVASNPSQVFLDLVGSLRSRSPGPDWDGVHRMTEK